MRELLARVLADDRAFLAEVFIDKAQSFEPKLASRRLPDGTMVSPPPEDMAPFLPRDELQAVMDELRADAPESRA